VTGGQPDDLVEARADFILADAYTVKAYAKHFEVQMHGGEFEAQMQSGEFETRMHRGKVRKLLALLRVFCREGVILLAVMLAPCALLGYAAFTPGPAPVMLSGANGVAAVNTASGRLAGVTPLPGPPGAVSAADGSVWVADPGTDQVSRIDPGTGAEAARVPVGGEPTARPSASRDTTPPRSKSSPPPRLPSPAAVSGPEYGGQP
jgi:YVTN family beta-propeller protein